MKQFAAALAGLALIGPAPPIETSDRQGIEAAIATYNDGLTAGDPAKVRTAIGESMFMFNGASSGDPTQWEAHMYVAPERLDTFLQNYVVGAGPHRNSYRLIALNVRGNGALATTEDTGANRFREWTRERVTWTLGKRDGQWKILGFFIRDIRNPS